MLMLNRIHRIPSFAQMQREMNGLFNALVSDVAPAVARTAGPAMNVWENQTHYFVEAELPGYKMEDIEVSVLGDEITVKGQRTITAAENASYLHRERNATQSFARTFTLPFSVQADKVEASLTDGVLLVSLPKSPEVQPRKIAVKSGR